MNIMEIKETDEELIKGFWTRVAEKAAEEHLSQEQINEACGFAKRRVGNLISRNASPDMLESYKIAKLLNVTLEFLISGNKAEMGKAEIESIKNKVLNFFETLC